MATDDGCVCPCGSCGPYGGHDCGAPKCRGGDLADKCSDLKSMVANLMAENERLRAEQRIGEARPDPLVDAVRRLLASRWVRATVGALSNGAVDSPAFRADLDEQQALFVELRDLVQRTAEATLPAVSTALAAMPGGEWYAVPVTGRPELVNICSSVPKGPCDFTPIASMIPKSDPLVGLLLALGRGRNEAPLCKRHPNSKAVCWDCVTDARSAQRRAEAPPRYTAGCPESCASREALAEHLRHCRPEAQPFAEAQRKIVETYGDTFRRLADDEHPIGLTGTHCCTRGTRCYARDRLPTCACTCEVCTHRPYAGQRRERAKTSTGGESHMPVETPSISGSPDTRGDGPGEGPVGGDHHRNDVTGAPVAETPRSSCPNASRACEAALLMGRAAMLEAVSWPGKNEASVKYEADELRREADAIEALPRTSREQEKR